MSSIVKVNLEYYRNTQKSLVFLVGKKNLIITTFASLGRLDTDTRECLKFSGGLNALETSLALRRLREKVVFQVFKNWNI